MNRDQVAAFVTAWHTAARTDEGKDHERLDEYKDTCCAPSRSTVNCAYWPPTRCCAG